MMKKMLMTLACAAAAFGAGAWEITLTTNATATMILPPAADYSQSYLQITPRSVTNESITMGAMRRIGPTVLVASNTGNTTNTTTTTTSYIMNGIWYTAAASVPTNAAGGYDYAIVTNVSTVITPITVPASGLVRDGTVYWFKVPASRTAALIQPTITGGYVEYSDVSGNKVSESTSLTKLLLEGYNGALYGRASVSNNCTVNILSW